MTPSLQLQRRRRLRRRRRPERCVHCLTWSFFMLARDLMIGPLPCNSRCGGGLLCSAFGLGVAAAPRAGFACLGVSLCLVCVCMYVCRHACAQRAACDMFKFTIVTRGALPEAGIVRYDRHLPGGSQPCALIGAPIGAMLTAAGDAWAEVVLLEGDGFVDAMIASDGLGTLSRVDDGILACARVTLRGGARMRLRYVRATRMASVVVRGAEVDMGVLPATADIAHIRFGVRLTRGNSVRIQDVSTAGTRARGARAASLVCIMAFVAFHRVRFHALRACRVLMASSVARSGLVSAWRGWSLFHAPP